MALTAKQKMFVKEYLVDLNSTQAAIRAGYSAKTADRIGPELLGKTCVSQAIQEAKQERSDRLDLTADWVLQRFKDISDRCMQAEPVLDREGNETGEYKFDASGANRSTELIGKHLGMFVDKSEVKTEVTYKIKDPFDEG
jgi:phage terminase small subunit